MDLMNRGNRPVQQNPQTPESPLGAPKAPNGGNNKTSSKLKDSGKLIKAGYIIFLAAIAALILAVVLSLVFVKDTGSKEEGYVKDDKLQAVFLNGGQVYFGKIRDLNSKYLTLDNIYYLRVNQQVQPDQANNPSANDISLVKLGCELHGPEDAMVINREQVIFWENLKGEGQVAKAVDEYVKANPDGQKCEEQQNNGSGAADGNNNNANNENATPNNTQNNTQNNNQTNTNNTTPATP